MDEFFLIVILFIEKIRESSVKIKKKSLINFQNKIAGSLKINEYICYALYFITVL